MVITPMMFCTARKSSSTTVKMTRTARIDPAKNDMYLDNKIRKVKVSSYIARYPVLGTAQSALHFTLWQTCSFQCQLDFPEKHSAMPQLLLADCSSTYPSLSIVRYSFIWLCGLRQRGVNEIAKCSKQQKVNFVTPTMSHTNNAYLARMTVKGEMKMFMYRSAGL